LFLVKENTMRQSMLRVFMLTWSIFPLVVYAGQSLLHAPSREQTREMMTAPPLEESPEYTHAPKKRFYHRPTPMLKWELNSTAPLPPSTREAKAQVRNSYSSPSTQERLPHEPLSQGRKCNGKILDQGLASWYGPGFHGRQTASGKRYDQNGLTIAHKEWPFDLRVCIRNTRNNKEIIVTTTDRGPYWENRKFDLSKRAAEELGIIGPGTAYVLAYATD
jgi:rare lipoprotein A